MLRQVLKVWPGETNNITAGSVSGHAGEKGPWNLPCQLCLAHLAANQQGTLWHSHVPESGKKIPRPHLPGRCIEYLSEKGPHRSRTGTSTFMVALRQSDIYTVRVVAFSTRYWILGPRY